MYGFTDDASDQESEDGDSYKKMIERDNRRWKAADEVSCFEFVDDIFPINTPHRGSPTDAA